MRNAMNEVLRDWYVGDCTNGIERWNKLLDRNGLSDRLYVPSTASSTARSASIPACRSIRTGQLLIERGLEARRHEWLPIDADKSYLQAA